MTLSTAREWSEAGVPVPVGYASSSVLLARVEAAWDRLHFQSDIPAIEDLLHDECLFTLADGKVLDKNAYLESMRNSDQGTRAIDSEDFKIRLHGDAAVITGLATRSGGSNAQRWERRWRFTRIWVTNGRAWKMVASHSSPVNESSMDHDPSPNRVAVFRRRDD